MSGRRLTVAKSNEAPGRALSPTRVLHASRRSSAVDALRKSWARSSSRNRIAQHKLGIRNRVFFKSDNELTGGCAVRGAFFLAYRQSGIVLGILESETRFGRLGISTARWSWSDRRKPAQRLAHGVAVCGSLVRAKDNARAGHGGDGAAYPVRRDRVIHLNAKFPHFDGKSHWRLWDRFVEI